jgi:hypothetical protein
MRLVGVCEVDRWEHRDLAGIVELLQPRERRMPAEVGYSRERQRRLRRNADARPQLAVPRVDKRDEGVQPVIPTVLIDQDKDLAVGILGGLGSRGFKEPLRREATHTGRGQEHANSTGEDVSAGQPT